MKKPSELFRDAYLRTINKPYETKFKEGDVIINVQYGVISLVVSIGIGSEYKHNPLHFNGALIEVKDSPYQYELKDIKNSKTKKDINKKFNRYQSCEVIDKFYEKIDPVTARLLYGVG